MNMTLITSGTAKGKCPVCGAPSCSCGGPSNVVPVDERVTRSMKGKMVRIDVGRGRGVQMYEDEARRRGLLQPEAKPERPARNKKRSPERNKGVSNG